MANGNFFSSVFNFILCLYCLGVWRDWRERRRRRKLVAYEVQPGRPVTLLVAPSGSLPHIGLG